MLSHDANPLEDALLYPAHVVEVPTHKERSIMMFPGPDFPVIDHKRGSHKSPSVRDSKGFAQFKIIGFSGQKQTQNHTMNHLMMTANKFHIKQVSPMRSKYLRIVRGPNPGRRAPRYRKPLGLRVA
jgi:hypothetical protein